MSSHYSFLHVMLLSFISLYCSTEKSISQGGVLVHKYVGYNDNRSIGLEMNLKIWFRDSLAIEEVSKVYFRTDTNDVTTRRIEVDHYLFLNQNSHTAYVFKNFSDTSRLLNKFILGDTDEAKGGGWVYYREEAVFRNPTTAKDIADTTIAGVKYQRMAFTGIERNNIITVGFFDCNMKKAPITLFQTIGKKLGCPGLKKFNYLPGKDLPSSTSELLYLADSLTEKETVIFDSWDKHAKNNPIPLNQIK